MTPRCRRNWFTATLGRSVRAVVPILDGGGQVRGRVGVGITLDAVSRGLRQRSPVQLGAAAIALLLAGAGSWLVGRWMRRQTQVRSCHTVRLR